MNVNPVTCDDRQLRRALQAEATAPERPELLDHVEHCAHCQQRLEELAASSHDWTTVGAALSVDAANDTDADADGGRAPDDFIRWCDSAAVCTEAMARALLAPPSHPEMLGRLGRYEIERMLGAGGMGVVFKAFDSELNRPVAIKILAPHLSGSGSARKRFAREARAAAAIVHEHVVPIHNVETSRDAPFLVMPYIAGESLQGRLDRAGSLQLCEVLRIGRQIAAGLSAAHQQGLVHRDIKPSNILLEEGVERALITDFGLARAVDDATLTRSGFHPGTPQYMSPEQAAGESVDARSDLFSLGSVLYTMCTGRSPFRAESSLSVLRRIIDDEPRRIREINPGIPEWLCAIIGRLMAKRPDDRYQSAAEVANLLEACLAHVQQPEFIPLPPELMPTVPNAARCRTRCSASISARLAAQLASVSRMRRWAKRHPFTSLVATTSLAAVCAAVWAAWFLFGPADAGLAALQGEWQAVESEREGVTLNQNQLYNERLIVRGARFSRPQTAPDGREIPGESGRLVLATAGKHDAIDLRLWGGTAYGLFKLDGDQLILCVTRSGGARPDSFRTKPGDSRVLTTYRRKSKPVDRDASGSVGPSERNAPMDDVEDDAHFAGGEAGRKWAESWIRKVSVELQQSNGRDAAKQWLQEQGFQNLVCEAVTPDVLRRLHPVADVPPPVGNTIRFHLYGLLRSPRAEHRGAAIEIHALYDAEDKLQVVHAGPLVRQVKSRGADQPAARIDTDVEAAKWNGRWRVVARSTAGVEQPAEAGRIFRIQDLRMDEVRLDLEPNQQPKRVDVVFLKGPEKGKVLKGIYEWTPAGTTESLRICTFTEPHPDRPEQRPSGFEAGHDVDTAIWERVAAE